VARRRVERVGALLKSEISTFITQRMNDPALGFVTVTEVVPAPDLRSAKVYVSVMGDLETQHRALKVLERARKHIQAAVAQRVILRNFPVFSFHLDDRVKRSIRISQLLKRASEEDHGDAGADEDV
jgi:ribosome-binding factor A